MKGRPVPTLSIFLALSTLTASCAVAIAVNGSALSNVTILELRDYGVDNDQLAGGEWWRLLTAQFIHVRYPHMLFNVMTLFLLAAGIERATSSYVLASVWLPSGVAGTYASIYSGPPPYDIGTGASQALMGVAAAAVILLWRNRFFPRWLLWTATLTIGLQIALDLFAAQRLKPGHTAGFLVGLILAIVLLRKRTGHADGTGEPTQ